MAHSIYRYFLLVVLLIISLSVSGDQRNVRFTYLTNMNGLPNNTVYTICQDYKGFIWLGTKSGLCKFDGNKMSVYTSDDEVDNGLPNNQIRHVYEDNLRRLWVVTLDGIRLYNRDKDKFEATSEKSSTLSSKSMLQTEDGTLYIGGENRLNYFDEKKKDFEPVLINGQQIEGYFTGISSDKQGRIWVSTQHRGLWCIDINRAIINKFTHNPAVKKSISSNKIQSIYIDSKDRVWVGTEDKGVCYFDNEKKEFVSVSKISNVCVRTFLEVSDDNIWIGSENGLYIYDIATDSIINKKRDYINKYSLNDNAIYCLFKDRENNLLIGTYFGGVNIYPYSFKQFSHYNYGTNAGQLSGKIVRKIIGDEKDNLWVATEDGGLNYFDRKEKRFIHVEPDKTKENSLPYHNVHSLLLDSKDNLWIGTFLGGLNRYNLKTKQFEHYTIGSHPNMIVNNIFSLIEDKDGIIWAGTTDGLTTLDVDKNQFNQFKPYVFKALSIDHVIEDSEGLIWIATRQKGVFCYNKKTQSIQNFLHDPKTESIPDNYINYLFEDSKGYIWIGTHEKGLCRYDKNSGNFKFFTKENHLPSNAIFSIIEDDMNNLWISTNNGLSCYNTTNESITNYSISEGLPNKQFNYNSAYKDKDGILFFGTIDGMISFCPKDLQKKEDIATVEFTDFKIFGKSVSIEDDNSPLKKSIGDADEIKLTHEQSKSFTFDYTVPSISHASSISFATKLSTDNEWSYVGSQRHITFANIPPGKYTLMIKASMNNKWTDSDPIRSIKLTIIPPFWKSTTAYIIYSLALIAVILASSFIVQNRQKRKRILLTQQIEEEKTEEVNSLKLAFFTNISHQLRMPLSIIIAPLQALMDKNAFTATVEPQISLVIRNANKMKNLIEELSLFTKVKNQQNKICVQKGTILSFVYEVAMGFNALAEEKNLTYKININSPEREVYFAIAEVEKIVHSLLSNAFKHTNNGAITINAALFDEKNYTCLKLIVANTGADIDNLQTDSSANYDEETELGIGLSLTKELVLRHKGSIKTQDQEDKGNTLTVTINVSKNAFDRDEISDEDIDQNSLLNYNFSPIITDQYVNHIPQEYTENGSEEKQYSILVAEDDPELLDFYKTLFRQTYTVYTATNGKEGLEMAIEKTPDIIVSDVMMPKIDGYELTKKLKANISTSHIPIILLTAKVGQSSELEGYESGADLYIEKPFHPTLIQKQIANLITTRENQKKKFQSNLIQVDDIITNDRDKKLITEIESLILENIDNEELSINDILKNVGIGRTLLHVKLKNLVGLSATQFINNIRLRESLIILMSGGNVSEAAYATGFSSPNYYSRCFKKQFGVSPIEYLERYKNKTADS